MPITSIVTPAPRRPLTTPDRLRAAVPSDEDDARLESRIRLASSLIENHCGRVFARERLIESAEGTGLRVLVLSRTPIITIHALNVGDRLLDHSLTDARAGLLAVPAGHHEDMWLALGGPRLYDHTPVGTQRYLAEYTGGFILPGWTEDPATGLPPEPDLPAELEQAVFETVRAMQEHGTTTNEVQSERLGDYSVTYRGSRLANPGLPRLVLDMLEPYRAIVL